MPLSGVSNSRYRAPASSVWLRLINRLILASHQGPVFASACWRKTASSFEELLFVGSSGLRKNKTILFGSLQVSRSEPMTCDDWAQSQVAIAVVLMTLCGLPYALQLIVGWIRRSWFLHSLLWFFVTNNKDDQQGSCCESNVLITCGRQHLGICHYQWFSVLASRWWRLRVASGDASNQGGVGPSFFLSFAQFVILELLKSTAFANFFDLICSINNS